MPDATKIVRIIVWRHGVTEWNARGRLQGQADTALSAIGVLQAASAAEALAGWEVNLIVSSDLLRAVQTAEQLSAKIGLPITRDSRLRERSYGAWEGLTDEEIERRFPDAYARWRADAPVPEHGLEDSHAVRCRVTQALKEIAASGVGTTVVVTHSGAARRGMSALLGGDKDAYDLAPSFWSELHFNGRDWSLHQHNVAWASKT